MQCDKCKGFVYSEYGDIRCLNCGKVFVTPDAPPIIDPLDKGLCKTCQVREATRLRGDCSNCQGKKISEGMKRQKEFAALGI